MTESECQQILDFLHDCQLATIATVEPISAVPESALIAFAELDSFEIIFETFVDSRKFTNLLKNPHVSLVAGWDPTHHVTFQYEGVALPVARHDLEAYVQIVLQKDTPCTETFLRDPRARLFKITPTWMRYSDYSQGTTPKIIEHRF